MPVPGRPLQDQKVNRHPPTHEWVEVERKPFPADRVPVSMPKGLPLQTRKWWEVVTRMPHCVLWDENDWQFCVDTAYVHAKFIKSRGMSAAAELRVRGSRLGMTLDDRRSLRIRYVEPKEEDEEAPVTRMADFEQERRARIANAD